MVSPKYRRQAALFLIAVLLPAVVFVGLALQVIRQKGELAEKTEKEERSVALDRIRHELSSRLNEIREEELRRTAEQPSGDSTNPAVVFSGRIQDARFRLEDVSIGDESKLPGQALWERQRAEQLEGLVRDFEGLRKQIQSVAGLGPDESAWVAYGADPWLVTVLPQTRALVVSSHLVAPDTILMVGNSASSLTLGGNFINLSVQWSPSRLSRGEDSLPTPVLITGLLLILGIMSFVGYLFVRDMSREAGLAEMRTQFVADVSHELKTPLTAIRLYADKLALGPSLDQDKRAEYVQTIINESERLGRLVDNVLAFSEIDSGARAYQPQPTALAGVIESAANSVGYLFAQRGFQLNVWTAENVPAVNVDREALEQAILNLLVNGMKYSGDARRIDLQLHYDQKEAVIEVADQGVGIAPKDQARIFEKFQRLRAPGTGHVAGTGLGLALVQHFARAHGGRVEVKSTLGAGSTFSIHLPRGAA